MQYNIANLPALMLRETPMLGVSTMMLHHLSVTFKIYLMFVWCALRCVLRRASCEASVDLASTWGWGPKILPASSRMGAADILWRSIDAYPWERASPRPARRSSSAGVRQTKGREVATVHRVRAG